MDSGTAETKLHLVWHVLQVPFEPAKLPTVSALQPARKQGDGTDLLTGLPAEPVDLLAVAVTEEWVAGGKSDTQTSGTCYSQAIV